LPLAATHQGCRCCQPQRLKRTGFLVGHEFRSHEAMPHGAHQKSHNNIRRNLFDSCESKVHASPSNIAKERRLRGQMQGR
jgi:hypothetical protein